MVRSRRNNFLPLVVALAAGAALSPGIALAHGDIQARPAFTTLLTAWETDPFVILGLIATCWLYWSGVRRVDRLHPASPFPRRHVIYFGLGIAALVLALLSPLAAYDTTLFSAHMIQHMLLMFVAAPLLLEGRPMTLALRAANPRLRKETLIPILHSRVVRSLTFPPLAWVFFAATMWASHFTGVFNYSLEHVWSHRAEHIWYITAGLLFWWPVVGDIGPWRISHPAKAIYLFLAMPQNAFVGNAIYSTKTVLYDHYAGLPRNWGPTPLYDQELAGAMMWIVGDLLFLGALCFVAYGWVKHEERSTKRTDRQLARERAAAAAGADGQGALSGS